MRPFKFFFGFSLALIVFFFLARVLFMALIAAAVLSVIFFVARKVFSFFRYLSWREDYAYEYDRPFRETFRPRQGTFPRYQFDDGLLFDSWEGREANWQRERIIEVR